MIKEIEIIRNFVDSTYRKDKDCIDVRNLIESYKGKLICKQLESYRNFSLELIDNGKEFAVGIDNSRDYRVNRFYSMVALAYMHMLLSSDEDIDWDTLSQCNLELDTDLTRICLLIAAEVIMPSKKFSERFISLVQNQTIEDPVDTIADEFNVTYHMARRRATELGLILF